MKAPFDDCTYTFLLKRKDFKSIKNQRAEQMESWCKNKWLHSKKKKELNKKLNS